MNNIITIELSEFDARRLLWLIQKETTNNYWQDIAEHIKQNIDEDIAVLNEPETEENHGDI